ncbi:MAG TPA: four helix bundle protein [Kofleriaceae bacterium]|nr:four helix bundle protein [Kofleriaceae bacterium]
MFKALEIAMRLIAAVRPIVEAVMPRDKNLATQLRDAATSAAANTAEGGRRVGGDRNHSFTVAGAEAAEALVWSRIAVQWGYVPQSRLDAVTAIEDELQAVLYRLRYPRR